MSSTLRVKRAREELFKAYGKNVKIVNTTVKDDCVIFLVLTNFYSSTCITVFDS